MTSTSTTTPGTAPGTAVAAACAGFGRDVEDNLAQIGRLVADARARGVGLLSLPEACLGGDLSVLGVPAATAATTSSPRTCPPSWTSTAPSCGASPRSRGR